jgi:HD-GYP domain-containing protein (c-di-GMP phosphodiesterase class II)
MIQALAEPKQDQVTVAVLYHGDHAAIKGIEDALNAEHIELRGLDALSSAPRNLPGVWLLDAETINRPDAQQILNQLPEHIVAVATDEQVEAQANNERVMLTLPESGKADAKLRVLRAAYQLSAAKLNAERIERELARSRIELNELHRIGMALMTERDPDKLLVRILEQARRLTHSDAGSLYLVESDEEDGKRLRFKLTQNDTLPDLPLVQFTLPINTKSMAGYAAFSGEPVVIDDAYSISEDKPYSFGGRSFDERTGYRTKSMLVVPMMDHKNDVVGVLQLLNRKTDQSAHINSEEAADKYVISYGGHELKLLQSLAGQAAVSIENSQLYAQIEHLFESFVRAAVTAIDQRDPTTAGHSIRVASLTVDIAGAVERGGIGPWKDTRFTREQMKELQYAAMLHDFGKVGVREEVLVKAKKLPPTLWERVQSRFDVILRSAEAEYYRQRSDLLQAHGINEALLQQLEMEYSTRREQLEKFQTAVLGANEPTILPEAAAGILDEIAQHKFTNSKGETIPYIDESELHFLKIPKGTLDERERLEIESHVEQTYKFLTQIPWTEDLQNLAMIAYGHHEKLNGKGYPRGVSADQIPIQTRMMTIADIFDALTASDRPYKRALPVEKALNILQMEAKDGLVDQDLVDLVIQSEVYKKILEQDWRDL